MTMKVNITIEDGRPTETGTGVTATSDTSLAVTSGELSAGPAPVQPATDASATDGMANDVAPAAHMAAGQAISAGPAPSEK